MKLNDDEEKFEESIAMITPRGTYVHLSRRWSL